MKLPNDVLQQVAFYYAIRELSTNHKNPNWDKAKLLNNLGRKAKRHKIEWSACAGTFWFWFPRRKTTYRMSESTFPNLVKETRLA